MSFRRAAVDLFLDTGFPRADVILRMGYQVLPRLQPLEVKVALGGLERQRLPALLKLRLVDESLLQRHKGRLAQLHLPLQRVAPVLELPRAFFRSFASPIRLLSLLNGSGASLSRGHKRCFGLCVVKITLVACKTDGHLQLVPFLG